MFLLAGKSMMRVDADRLLNIETENSLNISHWLDKMMVIIFSVTKRVQFVYVDLLAVNRYRPEILSAGF